MVEFEVLMGPPGGGDHGAVRSRRLSQVLSGWRCRHREWTPQALSWALRTQHHGPGHQELAVVLGWSQPGQDIDCPGKEDRGGEGDQGQDSREHLPLRQNRRSQQRTDCAGSEVGGEPGKGSLELSSVQSSDGWAGGPRPSLSPHSVLCRPCPLPSTYSPRSSVSWSTPLPAPHLLLLPPPAPALCVRPQPCTGPSRPTSTCCASGLPVPTCRPSSPA